MKVTTMLQMLYSLEAAAAVELPTICGGEGQRESSSGEKELFRTH
jgi:hypothetical protein